MKKKQISYFLMLVILLGCKQSNNELIIYNANIGDFSFLSITSPKISRQLSKSSIDITSYSYEYNKYTVSVSFYKMSNEILGIENEASLVLDNMVGGAINNTNSTLIDIKDVFLDGIPGKEFTSIYPSGITGKSRIFLKDLEKVYMITISNNGLNSINDSLVDRIINSLQIPSSMQKIATKTIEKDTIESFQGYLELSELKKILQTNIGFSDFFLKNKGWEEHSQFDKLVFENGTQYHSYNFIFPTDTVFIAISIIPFFKVDYHPSDSTFLLLENKIKRNYTKSDSIISHGFKHVFYEGIHERFDLIYQNRGNNTISVIQGLGK